jgi:hypothetical protein
MNGCDYKKIIREQESHDVDGLFTHGETTIKRNAMKKVCCNNSLIRFYNCHWEHNELRSFFPREREDQVYKHDFKLTLLVVIKSLRENYSEVV